MSKKYQLIYADPPWQYRDKANSGERGACHKYPVMKIEDLNRLPVWDLADENCLLAMWWVGPMPLEAIQLVKAWGFRLFNMKGFTWHKLNKSGVGSKMGMGHLTRGNTEDMLFAVKGRLPKRFNAGIIQHISAPIGRHSEKPDVFRHLLVDLIGDVPRIELFSRDKKTGWDTWGNECSCDVKLVSGHFEASNG